MYIVEKLIKFYKFITKKYKVFPVSVDVEEELEDMLICKHHFMPLDSTGQIFACTKCGYVVTKKRLKNK